MSSVCERVDFDLGNVIVPTVGKERDKTDDRPASGPTHIANVQLAARKARCRRSVQGICHPGPRIDQRNCFVQQRVAQIDQLGMREIAKHSAFKVPENSERRSLDRPMLAFHRKARQIDPHGPSTFDQVQHGMPLGFDARWVDLRVYAMMLDDQGA